MSSIIKKSERTIYIPKGRRGKATKKVVDCAIDTGDIINEDCNNCSANVASNILTSTVEDIPVVKEESSHSPKWERGVELYIPKGRREKEAKKSKESKESKVETEVISNVKGTVIDEGNSSNGTSSALGATPSSESEKPESSLSSSTTTVSKRVGGSGLYVPKGRRDKVAKNQKMETEDTTCGAIINSTPHQEITTSSTIISDALTSLSISAENNLLPEEESPQTGSTTAAPKRDKPFELYIPKGRKLLNEQKQKEKIVPVESTKKKVSSKKSGREDSDAGSSEAATSAKKSCTEEKLYVPRIIKEDEFFYGKLSDDDLLLCCLVLKGVPADLNDGARSSCIEFFLQRGASATWRPSGECILVFRSESFLDSAVTGWNIQMPSAVYRVQRFNNLIDNRDEILLVGREAFSRGFKPLQRDTTVANRFIGAALGVRVPQKPRNLVAHNQSVKTSKDHPNIVATATTSNPTVVIVDAWDD